MLSPLLASDIHEGKRLFMTFKTVHGSILFKFFCDAFFKAVFNNYQNASHAVSTTHLSDLNIHHVFASTMWSFKVFLQFNTLRENFWIPLRDLTHWVPYLLYPCLHNMVNSSSQMPDVDTKHILNTPPIQERHKL